MHIPPYHKKATWQRFFVGGVIGAILAYGIYLYIYGSLYEQLLEENLELEAEVTELEKQNEALTQDKEDLDAQREQPIIVETIEINITNDEELRLDRLIVHQLEELINEEINHLIGENVTIIDESSQLLRSSVENKGFTVDDFTYYFDVAQLTVSRNMILTVEAKLTDE
ncbi:sporulation membrane protein YtrI [Virgibacillus sp. CBA3643]|uniref:sporulation membrane protein YtrI n=1 Tax=Virgibacillus sp. CBA3643 TaxID=2942278 RepID=UPI0035A3BC96